MDKSASRPEEDEAGERITPTPPYGGTVVVYRRAGPRWEYLLLHRSHNGPAYGGDWAWTSPSGSRWPDEDFEECAARELFEETGLRLMLRSMNTESGAWLVYGAESSETDAIHLSPEHDRFVWLPLDQALNLVTPAEPRIQLERAARLIEST
jgi:8-oxo-dGTP pyrophosphatase MutT (NUDIX family)